MAQPPQPQTTVSKPQQDDKNPLADAVRGYPVLGRRRFHMPGHAGRDWLGLPWLPPEVFQHDLTELEGMDVLSEPSGCIAEAQERAAEVFGVAHSFFLINGASVGIMAGMLSILRPGDKVLVPRNAHRSVMSGLILSGAEPVWFLPEMLPDWGLWGAVSLEEVRRQIALQPDIKALVVTSPTYEGIGSDISALAELCQAQDVYLLVDEAHGSLRPFSKALPASACHAACDVVIHSLHKSAGSLTQTAIAHLPKDSRIAPDQLQQALNMLQSTSPSYLLLSSLDAACGFLASSSGQERIALLLTQVANLRDTLVERLAHFRLFQAQSPHWDPTKLYLLSPKIPAENWAVSLEQEEGISFESVSPYGALYHANLGLEPEDYQSFQEVFLRWDARLQQTKAVGLPEWVGARLPVMAPVMVMTPRNAYFASGEKVPISKALGRISKQTVVHCPPGIPVLLHGELIEEHHLSLLPPEGVWVVA